MAVIAFGICSLATGVCFSFWTEQRRRGESGWDNLALAVGNLALALVHGMMINWG